MNLVKISLLSILAAACASGETFDDSAAAVTTITKQFAFDVKLLGQYSAKITTDPFSNTDDFVEYYAGRITSFESEVTFSVVSGLAYASIQTDPNDITNPVVYLAYGWVFSYASSYATEFGYLTFGDDYQVDAEYATSRPLRVKAFRNEDGLYEIFKSKPCASSCSLVPESYLPNELVFSYFVDFSEDGTYLTISDGFNESNIFYLRNDNLPLNASIECSYSSPGCQITAQ